MNLPRGGVRHARFEEGSDEVLVTFYMTEDRSRDAVTRVGVPLSVVNGLYGLPLSVRHIFRQLFYLCTYSRPRRATVRYGLYPTCSMADGFVESVEDLENKIKEHKTSTETSTVWPDFDKVRPLDKPLLQALATVCAKLYDPALFAAWTPEDPTKPDNTALRFSAQRRGDKEKRRVINRAVAPVS